MKRQKEPEGDLGSVTESGVGQEDAVDGDDIIDSYEQIRFDDIPSERLRRSKDQAGKDIEVRVVPTDDEDASNKAALRNATRQDQAFFSFKGGDGDQTQVQR